MTDTLFSWLDDSSGLPTLSGIEPDATLDDIAQLGRFRVVGLLGEGGMGRVLLARDPDLQRDVAVKVLRARKGRAHEMVDRFLAEARLTAQLQHPNIVPVHELGVSEEGYLYFVMKRVEGESLASVLKGLAKKASDPATPRRRRRLLEAFRQVCQAMAYAHRRGILHRDIKPSNIMLGPFGEVLMMDWGLARLLEAADAPSPHDVSESSEVDIDRFVTAVGTRLGTPAYMSPEQARGEPLDVRTDVWSLGVVLYEIITGTRALRGQGIKRLLDRGRPIPSPQAPEGQPPLPDELVELCNRALDPDRDGRFDDAKALADAVDAFLQDERRAEAARKHAADAQVAWQQHKETERTLSKLLRTEELLRDLVPPWKPLSEKEALLAVRRQLREARHLRRDLFERVVLSCERALGEDPLSDARAMLSLAHFQRSEEAEEARQEELAEHHRRRAMSYDDGRLAARLEQDGRLRLRTDPPGAEVVCQRVDTSGILFALSEPIALGLTPLEDVALAPGSYILTVSLQGRLDTTYPVSIKRGQRWDPRDPVRLLRPGDVPEGFRYVPAGEFLSGGGDAGRPNSTARQMRHLPGFLLAELPITCGQYAEFLTDVADLDPDGAWARVPRAETGFKQVGGQYWLRPAPGDPYRTPKEDRDGDPWDPNWPAVGISWHDCKAYCRWVSLRIGREARLVRDWEWEKAARGVDGRRYPWGNQFDASLCSVSDSRPGRAMVQPVGSSEDDMSVYGVRDLAGGVKDWCDDIGFEGDPEQRPVRGGFWHGSWGSAQLFDRTGNLPNEVYTIFGFRLALDLPPAR